MWVTPHSILLCQAVSSCHPMTTSWWVTAHFFDRKSHHVKQAAVSDAAKFFCQAISPIMSHPMTNSKWVTNCFISLPGSLVKHVSSHDWQSVSDPALCLCKSVSSMMFHPPWPIACEWHCQAASSMMSSHPMTNRKWVMLLYFFANQSHLMTNSLWVTLSGSLRVNHVLYHDQQGVSDTTLQQVI